MKKRMRRDAAFLLAALFLIAAGSGCTYEGKTVYFTSGSGEHNIFKLDTLSCSEAEARVYLSNDKNIYGNVLGQSLWSGGYDTARMEESIKDAVLQHLSKVYALNLYAEKEGISLTEKERLAVEKAAKEYDASLSEEERAYLSVTAEDIKGMYERYALAEKVYFTLIEAVDPEVSEDEARVMDAKIFYTTDVSEVPRINELLAEEDTDFDAVAAMYHDGESTIDVTFSRGTFPEKVEDAAFRLDNDEISGVVTGDDGNYYFIKCVNKYNEALSEENKANVIAARQAGVIEDLIEHLGSEYYSDFNKTLWDSLSVPTEESITTDGFFAILDENLTYP